MDFEKYLIEFERKIFIEGYKNGLFNKRDPEIVPLKNQKLSNTSFGRFIGNQFKFDQVLSINYYGLFKLSSEIVNVAEQARQIYNFGIRSIKVPVIYFSSLRIETIKKLSPELFIDYPEFKKHIVNLRWNKTTSKN